MQDMGNDSDRAYLHMPDAEAVRRIKNLEADNARLEDRLAEKASLETENRRLINQHRILLSSILSYRKINRLTKIDAILRLFGWNTALDKIIGSLRRSGLFDDRWYLSNYSDVAISKIDPLVHYLFYGAFEGRKPNPFFDSKWYLENNPDVAESGLNPLVHFVQHGATERRAPHPELDPGAYVRANPELLGILDNPLTHYLRKHGSMPHAPPSTRQKAEQLRAPTIEAFSAAISRKVKRGLREGQNLPIDIIVPVYRGYHDTLACLYSVLSSPVETEYELVVINDASPEAELTNILRQLSSLGLFTLLENKLNRVFVHSVNRGMQLHRERSVVLLNSDTVVFNNWLDRLCAHAGNHVGTVTPLSNNATICSYPATCRDNVDPLELTYDELDRVIASVNTGRFIDVPTGVGFCMFIARAALDSCGYFDEDAYGLGYGEENDFCMRASANGFRNIMALDVFVQHKGEVSFAANAVQLRHRAAQTLHARFPAYDALVRNHVQADPAITDRARIDLARLMRQAAGLERTLCITHNRGGGISTYLKRRSRTLAERSIGLVTLTPTSPLSSGVDLNSPYAIDVPNLKNLSLWGHRERLISSLRELRVGRLEIHSLVGWSHRALRAVPALAESLGIPYHFFVHDYTSICPQTNLVGHSGTYCGEKGTDQCRECLAQRKSPAVSVHGPTPWGCKDVDIDVWREAYTELLHRAATVKVPSLDARSRINRYFPSLKVICEPHNAAYPQLEKSLRATELSGEARIAIIGAIGEHKGSRTLLECAKDAATRQLPLRFIIIGFTDRDRDLERFANVDISGPYDDINIFKLLAGARAHAVFLPSVCPETYSYTLSIAHSARVPVAVFDLGAQAERARNQPHSTILPLHLAADKINDRLLQLVRAST